VAVWRLYCFLNEANRSIIGWDMDFFVLEWQWLGGSGGSGCGSVAVAVVFKWSESEHYWPR
jgi:hypothetical protein